MALIKEIDLGIGCILHRVNREEVDKAWKRLKLFNVHSCPCCGSAVLPQYLTCNWCDV